MNQTGTVTQIIRVRLVLVVVFVWALGTAPAPGVVPSRVPDQKPHARLTFRVAVAMLKSDRWRNRRQAQAFLMNESPAKLAAILEALHRTHSLEQANRLFKIALQLYLRARTPLTGGPQAFLGVSYSMETLHLHWHGRRIGCQAAVLLELLPGFPAAAKLHAGELIVGINGRIFPLWMTANDFRRLIHAFKPAETVSLLVMRGRSIRTIQVRLVGVPPSVMAISEIMARRERAAANFAARYYRWNLTH